VHRWPARRVALLSPLTLLVTSCGLHFLYAWLFLEWGVYWWHFSAYGLTLALLLAAALHDLSAGTTRGRARRIAWAATTVLLLTAAPANLWGWWAKGLQHREWLAAARWAER